MTYLGCETCMATLQVHGDPEEFRQLIIEHPMWEQGRPCTTFECPGAMNPLDADTREAMGRIKETGVLPVVEVNVQEAFKALCGGGLPDELGVSPEFVSILLESMEKKTVFAFTSPTGRTLLQRIQVGGLMLHLSSSSYGPCVYKITRIGNELEDDHLDVHQDPEVRQVLGVDTSGGGAEGGGVAKGDLAGGGEHPHGEHEGVDHEVTPITAGIPASEGDDGTTQAEGVSEASGTR